MASTSSIEMKAVNQQLPPVPLTIEGSSVLHQMFRFRWTEWRQLAAKEKSEIEREARLALEQMEPRQTALYSLLGHKGDLIFVHFRNSFDELKQAELELTRLRLSD